MHCILQREAATKKTGQKYNVLIITHLVQEHSLLTSVLPEDDPVGSKHIVPHFLIFLYVYVLVK
jgi:hypothetical protein